jgi:hypothetical protein
MNWFPKIQRNEQSLAPRYLSMPACNFGDVEHFETTNSVKGKITLGQRRGFV